MKQFNEYEDKLVSVTTAVNAEMAGYKNISNGYDVECFCIEKGSKDKSFTIDAWSGMIPEDMIILAHRPTISGLQSWLRNNHRIHVFIGWRPNIQKFDSYAYSLDLSKKDLMKSRTMQKFTDQKIFNNYEDALEAGVNEGLWLIIDSIKQ